MLVIARKRAEMRPVLQELLRGEPAVAIVVDRRVGDRRRSRGEPAAGERRRDPNRRRRQADAILV
jgi:hypothetical protein